MGRSVSRHELAQFMAGVLAHAPALCGVFAPTVNSYKRLQPATWAPAHVGYGGGNRAALVRVPGKARRRIEFRAGDHTANPYLALTALIAAGLDGLTRALDPGAEAHGDLGHLSASEACGARHSHPAAFSRRGVGCGGGGHNRDGCTRPRLWAGTAAGQTR